MLNFTVGPVMMNDEVRALGAEQVPYFRTAEFSAVMQESERLMLKLTGAPQGSRAVFLTSSGTGAMEAVVMGTLDSSDKALVIDGGSFGHRFCQLCELHHIPYQAIKPAFGHGVSEGDLAPFAGQGFTALLVNLDETSTGVLYDLPLLGRFCRENGMFLVVDAISAFLCDPIDMAASGVGVMLTGSQKALACPPGASVVVLAPPALERIGRIVPQTMYFDLRNALKNGERGQTPFTPAVGTMLQINLRLRQVDAIGVEAEVAKVAAQAADFRRRVSSLPFSTVSLSPTNAVTPLEVAPDADAHRIFELLKDEYGIWICPNGGELAHRVFRVGHIGNLTPADNATLVGAFQDLLARGELGGR